MGHEPRPEGVLKDMERKATETYTFTKSGSHEEKCLAGRMSGWIFSITLENDANKRGVDNNTLVLRRFTEGFWRATGVPGNADGGMVQFEGPKKVPYCKIHLHQWSTNHSTQNFFTRNAMLSFMKSFKSIVEIQYQLVKPPGSESCGNLVSKWCLGFTFKSFLS